MTLPLPSLGNLSRAPPSQIVLQGAHQQRLDTIDYKYKCQCIGQDTGNIEELEKCIQLKANTIAAKEAATLSAKP